MNVFISSTITGMQELRDAAADAIRSLGYTPKRSEDYGASPASPQTVCLTGVREADLLVLILGERYGHIQESGISATHEEYREAKQRLDVLVFIERGARFETQQEAFVREVQDWARGHFTDEFSGPAELRNLVSRRLHELALSKASGKVDEKALMQRADELAGLGDTRGGSLSLIVVPGPAQSIVTLGKLEDAAFRGQLQQRAQFGPTPVFSRLEGVTETMHGDTLDIIQGPRAISLDETAQIRIVQPASPAERDWYQVLIEEQISERLTNAVQYAGWLLDQVDATNRLSDVAVVATLSGCSYHAWRTMDEQLRSPTSVTLSNLGERVIAKLSPGTRRRSALLHDSGALVQELLARLRRAAKD